MLQDHVTPLPLAVVVAVHVACVLASLAIVRTRTPDFPGWRVVGPGGIHWFCFVGAWGMATLISWVWLFVGSARSDAAQQMRWALLLILVFGVCAAWCGFYIAVLHRMALRWRGSAIRWRQRRREVVQDMTDFDAYRRALSGALHLRFRDGTILKLDLHSRNGEDFVVAMNERIGTEIE